MGPPAPQHPSPEYLDVTLDPSGRPYDEPLRRGATVERRPLAVLHAPSRRVLFMGGQAIPNVRTGDDTPVRLAERPGRRYPVHAVWLNEKNDLLDTTVGVVIVERDSPVARWRVLPRLGYSTDAGLGGITTVEWAARPKALENELSRLYWSKIVDGDPRWVTADVDGHAGVDTILFHNGFGDGGFPAVAGYDAGGRRAQIVLWTIVVPWRLAFPAGTPPPEVTKRENELAACLAGRRTMYGSRCRLAR